MRRAGDVPGRAGRGQEGEWFRSWFGEEYLGLYPHRDEEEARAAVDLLLRAAPPARDAAVLDLACGAGRHLRRLGERGVRAVGLDLSRTLLERARELGGGAPLVRGDMRTLPFRDAAFGGVASFFTSFGYFATREEDTRVLREARRVVRTGAGFLWDFLNAPRTRETLVPADERRVGNRTIRQTRWLEGDVVLKRIEIESADPPGREEYFERVRLYEPAELEALLERNGLRVTARFGDYEGGTFGRLSPRLLLAGRAVDAPGAEDGR